jgi:hypothetical protein
MITTFSDSCKTGDDKYILAKFRADQKFEWVRDLRAFLTVDELKWKHFEIQRHRVKSKADLWKKVEGGVFAASLTIIDPGVIIVAIQADLNNDGAEYGTDFNQRDLNDCCAHTLVTCSPLIQLPQKMFQDGCVMPRDLVSSDRLLARAGGKLSDAVVLTARAHSVFEAGDLPADSFDPGVSLNVARMALDTEAQFDSEHAKSIDVLNEALDDLEAAMPPFPQLRTFYFDPRSAAKRRVLEARSEDLDEIQAADMAAGWARDILLHDDYRGLARRFERVSVNGYAVAG